MDNKKDKIIIVSGGFDPVHVGHIKMFKAAHDLHATVVVGMNSDSWLMRKKGTTFMPFDERKEILGAIRYIDFIYSFDDEDDSACDLIRKVSQIFTDDTQIFFGNGGDRNFDNSPEVDYCEENDIELIWGLGGRKIQSSSDLVKNARS
jgi:D-beta-D-heptose 7-phosphate kinase/D-beta-D-heptose 1-phosphate adenosyltransferase